MALRRLATLWLPPLFLSLLSPRRLLCRATHPAVTRHPPNHRARRRCHHGHAPSPARPPRRASPLTPPRREGRHHPNPTADGDAITTVCACIFLSSRAGPMILNQKKKSTGWIPRASGLFFFFFVRTNNSSTYRYVRVKARCVGELTPPACRADMQKLFVPPVPLMCTYHVQYGGASRVKRVITPSAYLSSERRVFLSVFLCSLSRVSYIVRVFSPSSVASVSRPAPLSVSSTVLYSGWHITVVQPPRHPNFSSSALQKDTSLTKTICEQAFADFFANERSLLILGPRSSHLLFFLTGIF